MRFAILGVVLLASSLSAQQTVVTCPSGQVPTPTVAGQSATVVCVAGPVTPPPTTPAPTLTVNANPSTGGPGRTVTLTAVTTGGQTPFSYVVTLAGKPVTFTPVTASSGTIVAPSTAGQHLYTVALTDALTRKASANVTVTVTTGPVTPPLTEVCGDGIDNDKDGQVDEGCPVVPPPPPPAGAIWGTVDPAVLGEFSAAEHDAFVIDGGDGFLYRTWHPQCLDLPSGLAAGGFIRKCAAHEHGDNPASQGDAWVKANWDPRFGYASRRHPMPNEPNGHMEGHEGYKVFVANKGDTNDESRVNRTWTTSTFHMGVSGPGRYNVQHHSNSLASRHDWPGDPDMRIAYHLMNDTGGNATVCDPRVQAPTKDVIQLNSPCKLNSPYEIWGTTQTIKDANGNWVAVVFATPAVFDVTTVRNPANPTELVYATDPRVTAIKAFPSDSWAGFKGCIRETYAQNYYSQTQGKTTDTYWTDPMGNPVASTAPNAVKSYVQRGINATGVRSTADNHQFKMKVDYCNGTEPDRNGNTRAPRAGIAGAVSYAKLGLKN